MNKLYKSLETPTADIDEKSNTVTVYYAAFNNVDNGGDIILPSAFTKTIQERGPNGKDLIYHFKDHKEAISKPKELFTDAYGLKAVVSFPNTTKGRDVVEEYKFGLWKYHSIGYATIRKQKSDRGNELQELKLFEGGSVTWPMNELAITSSVDLKEDNPILQKLLKQMEAIEEFIANSKATDETIISFEAKLAEIKSLITAPKDITQPNIEAFKAAFNINI